MRVLLGVYEFPNNPEWIDPQVQEAINSAMPVTTAQREPDWYLLKQSDPFKILNLIDVIGANIYPFWGGSPEKINNKSIASTIIPNSVNKLKQALNKKVMVTEEGWPSCGSNPQTYDKTITATIDYFNAWRIHVDNFDSYYFAAFDNRSNLDCPLDDANNHFGLCQATGITKDKRLISCS